MAATLTLVAASPDSIKYKFAHASSGTGAASVTQAQMITDALSAGPGPSQLAPLLASIVANPSAAWSALQDDARLSVLVTSFNALPVGAALTSIGANQLTVTANDADVGATAEVEVRFRPTVVR